MIHHELHRLFYQATVEIFENEYLWVHVVAHVVMVVMPVILLIIGLRWIYLACVWVSGHLSFRAPFTFNNAYFLPAGLFGFIFRYSASAQLGLSVLALFTLPVTYMMLELPKRIINGAISFGPTGDFRWAFAEHLDKIDYLLLLCAIYLLMLTTSSVLKFVLNNQMGLIAERLLRRIRLITIREQKILSKQDSTRIPVITQEVEPVCSFAGDAFIVPLLNGGTLVTIITFMMLQNVVLGAAAVSLLPIQLIVIPRLQRKVNRYVRERISVVRELSNNLQEKNDLQERKAIRDQIRQLHDIRVRMFRIKFFMKSLNNFIMNLTPFFFYTIGGYLVLEDHLSLGALVASLASYKDLAPAIRELFKYYQRNQDAKYRYVEVRNYLYQAREYSLAAS